jgi:transposase
MPTTTQRDGRKERFWRRMVRRWDKSGLSVRAFCLTYRLSEPSFYAWRRMLKQRDGEAVSFVPVRVVPDDPSLAATAGASLELVLPAGRVLRVGPGFDAATLQRLLAVLEEGRP